MKIRHAITVVFAAVFVGGCEKSSSDNSVNAVKPAPKDPQVTSRFPGGISISDTPQDVAERDQKRRLQEKLEAGDFLAARAIVATHKIAKDHSALLAALASLALKDDLSRLSDVLAEARNEGETSLVIDIISQSWRGKARHLFEAAEKQLNGESRNELMGAAIRSLAQAGEFDAALSYLNKLPISQARKRALEETSNFYYQAAPLRAIDFLQSLEFQEDRATAALPIIGLAESKEDLKSLDALTKFFAGSGTDEERRSVEAAAKLRARTQSREELMNWAKSLSGVQYDRAIDVYIRTSEPHQSMSLFSLADSITDQSLRENSYVAIGMLATKADPDEASSAIFSLEPKYKHQAMLGMIAQMHTEDWERTYSWVQDLPQGHDRDDATSILARQMGPTNPESAKKLAAGIADEKLRKNTLDAIR